MLHNNYMFWVKFSYKFGFRLRRLQELKPLPVRTASWPPPPAEAEESPAGLARRCWAPRNPPADPLRTSHSQVALVCSCTCTWHRSSHATHTHTHTHTDHVDTFRLSHTADRMCDAQFVSWPQVQEPQVVWQLSAVLEEEEEEWVDTLEEDLSSRLHPRPALWAKAAMTAWTPWCLWKDCHSNGTGFWLLVVSSCNQGRSCT